MYCGSVCAVAASALSHSNTESGFNSYKTDETAIDVRFRGAHSVLPFAQTLPAPCA